MVDLFVVTVFAKQRIFGRVGFWYLAQLGETSTFSKFETTPGSV